MTIEDHIHFVLSKLIDYYSPQKIFLFGSQAREDANENSDIDFLVIKESDEPRHKRALNFRKELRGRNFYPIDILVYTPGEFENECNIKGTISYQVIKEGKLLYGSESGTLN